MAFERSAVDAERELRPEIWAGFLEAYQDVVLDAVCGARRAPLTRRESAVFGVQPATASVASGGEVACSIGRCLRSPDSTAPSTCSTTFGCGCGRRGRLQGPGCDRGSILGPPPVERGGMDPHGPTGRTDVPSSVARASARNRNRYRASPWVKAAPPSARRLVKQEDASPFPGGVGGRRVSSLRLGDRTA
jgi:hypothetical protein